MPITRKNVEVIFRPKNQFGRKEGGSSDVIKGAYDRAEKCELIGI